MATARSRIIIRISIVLATALVVAAGGYGFHKYRKRSIVRKAFAVGTAAYEAKQWTQAADNLGRYLTANPRDVEVLTKYAEAQMRRRPQSKDTVRQAASALETILRIQRGDPKASETLVQFYLAINAPIEAERVARAWSEVHPDDAKARQSVAAALIPQQKLDEALQILEALVAANPGQVDAAGALAFLRASYRNQSLQDSLRSLDAAVAADASPAAARLARARFFLATAQYSKARDDAEVVEKLNPGDLNSMLELAGLLADMGFHDRAGMQFDRAEKAFTDNVGVYLVRGRVLLDTGDSESGAKLADRALAAPLGEQRWDVVPLAAELYAAAKQVQQARQCIAQLKTIDTASEQILYLEGLAYLAEGKTSEAVASLQEATRRAPKFAQAHLALGRAYMRNDDPRHAVAPLEQAARLSGGSLPIAQIELASAYASLGRWSDAAGTAREAERQAPFNARVLLTSIETQGLAARPGGDQPDPATIDRLYQRIKPLAARLPDDVRIQTLLARLAAWHGKFDESVAVLTVLGKAPANRTAAATALSQIYQEAGKYEEAIRECRTAIDSADKQQQLALKAYLVELYLAAGKMEESTQAMEAALAQVSGSSRSALLVDMARSLLRANQRDKARDLLLKVAANDGRNVPARLLLLAILPAKEADLQRRQIVDQVKGIEGENGLNWRTWQARLWLEREDWAANRTKIESLLKECLAKSPDAEEATSLLAWLYEQSGQVEQAVAMYEQAVKSNPSDMRLMRRLLDAATQAQQWDRVDQLLSSLSSSDATLQPYFISHALRKGNSGRAQDLLQARIKADPSDYRSRLQLASLLRMQNDAAGAGQQLEEAARIAPDSLDITAARVEFHLSRSEGDQALALCNQALAAKAKPELLLLRAAVHEAKDNLDEAQKDLVQVSQADGWAERGCLAMGELQARHGQLEQAMQTWRQGLATAPKSQPIRQAIASVLLAGDDHQQAEGTALLEELLKERPGDESLLMLKAVSKEWTDPAAAEAIYDNILRRHPASAGACERLVRITANRGQRDRAVALVDQGLARNPRNMNLLFLKAELLAADSPSRAALVAKEAEAIARQALTIRSNNEDAAIALAQAKAVSGGPAAAIAELKVFLAGKDTGKFLNPRMVLARLYLSTKDFAQADEVIRQCMTLTPEDPRPMELRIRWHAAQEQWEPIQGLVETWRQKHPNDVMVTLLAAQQLAEASDPRYRQAAASLLELAEKRPVENVGVLAQLGLTYYRMGRFDQAKSTFEQAVQSRPKQIGLLNNLAWILCEHNSNPQAAQKVIGETVKVDTGTGDFASLLDTSGVVAYRLASLESRRQYLDESRSYLEACLRHPQVAESTKASATFHLARTLAVLGEPKARQLLESLLADVPQKGLLSAGDQAEAQKLLEQLRSQVATGASPGVAG